MKSKLLMLLMISVMLVSCKKDEEETPQKQTTAEITVLSATNEAVDGVSVYAYKENTWTIIGDNPVFSDKTVATDASGKAMFLVDDIHMIFSMDTQANLHFSVHYNIGGVDKTKTTAITFVQGDQKSASIKLD